MDLVKTDQATAAIVLTGSGKYFSSGADIQSTNFGDDRPPTLSAPSGRFMLALLSFPKIFAAAVNGPAVGIATTLLMHCDLVFCAPQATFWAPFSRLALVPELCSSVTFRTVHGMAKANELLLLGRRLDAETAQAWNICSRVVDRTTNDPFHPDSLGSFLCQELHEKLLQLPLGVRTASYFCRLVKTSQSDALRRVCLEELAMLDERFQSGQVQEAASALLIGKKKGMRSRL